MQQNLNDSFCNFEDGSYNKIQNKNTAGNSSHKVNYSWRLYCSKALALRPLCQLILPLNPTLHGGGHNGPPPSKISSCTSGIAFWVTQVGWQFLSTLILWGNICFWAKNYLEKVLEYHFWGKGHFSRVMKGIFLKLQKYVRGQNRGFWGWPT